MKQCHMNTGWGRSVVVNVFFYASGAKGNSSGLICLLWLIFHWKDVLSQMACFIWLGLCHPMPRFCPCNCFTSVNLATRNNNNALLHILSRVATSRRSPEGTHHLLNKRELG